MLFGTAIFCSSCLNMLLPAASMVSPYAVISVRIVQVQQKSDYLLGCVIPISGCVITILGCVIPISGCVIDCRAWWRG